jgi:hypothetical protein
MLIVLGFVRMLGRCRDRFDGGKSLEVSPTRLCDIEQLDVWQLPLLSNTVMIDRLCFI